MSQVIPWPNAPEWEQQIQIDGDSYRLRGRYNTFTDSWSMDFLLADKTPIVLGVKLTRGTPLLLYHVDTRLPPGQFFVIGDEDPSRSNMGNSVFLVYNND